MTPSLLDRKIFHILHVDRLPSVVEHGCLWCDSVMSQLAPTGTVIGMTDIKKRRLQLPLRSHPGLYVGDCVPFYFCPRSVMLYLLHRGNHPELAYRGGQDPIIHLQIDLGAAIESAEANGLRWAFTLSNAGSTYFEDRAARDGLDEIDWAAVEARQWSGPGIAPSVKEGKQAEFLIEDRCPWELVEKIGVFSREVAQQVSEALRGAKHRPMLEICREWYY